MAGEFKSSDWNTYKMDIRRPHLQLEPLEQEIAVVAAALSSLHEAGIIPHTSYDHDRMLAHRRAVAELFEIPWTAITPRMQRLLYAINAIVQPQRMIAAGVYCGNTFISNAGAAVGPGACYRAQELLGVEIKPTEAERAERNVRRIDPTGVARVIAADAVTICEQYSAPIDLLYLDADGDRARGKSIYLDILLAAWAKLHPGSIILAHNSVNCAKRLEPYLNYVRDQSRLRASVNVICDGEGLEVSVM
jgi:predicted O-methyltransferase YrrM